MVIIMTVGIHIITTENIAARDTRSTLTVGQVTLPCTQAKIDELQNKNLLPRTTPDTGMTTGETTRRLENAHRLGKLLNATQNAALQRYRVWSRLKNMVRT